MSETPIPKKQLGELAERTSIDGKERFLTQGGLDADVGTTDMQFVRLYNVVKNSLASLSQYTAPSTQLLAAELLKKIDVAQIGVADGIATLGSDGKIPTSQIPSIALVDVFTVASQAEMLALDAQQGDVAIRSDSGQVYILTQGPATTLENWIELSVLKEIVDAHANRVDNPHAVTKAQVGLANTDNTSDADKPVSTAQQTALDNKESVANVDILKGAGWTDENLVDHEERLDTLEGADTVTGSVAKTVKDAVDPIDERLTGLDTLTYEGITYRVSRKIENGHLVTTYTEVV